MGISSESAAVPLLPSDLQILKKKRQSVLDTRTATRPCCCVSYRVLTSCLITLRQARAPNLLVHNLLAGF